MIRLGLTGYPLGHSLSPRIHRAALNSCRLPGEYSIYPIPADDSHGLKDLLTRVRCGEITGLNVTIPHKLNVIPYLDELTPTARSVGAVNTIYLRNNKLWGENTDAPGFLQDLKRICMNGHSGENCSALVLGSGGAARAIIHSLLDNGWGVRIASRNAHKARALLAQFSTSGRRVSLVEINSGAFRSILPQLSLIVNTTPVGMSPDERNSPWPENLPMPAHAVIYDLVYHPPKTKFVRDALQAGLPATAGLGMLIEQAALAFEIWTGCRVDREQLLAAVEET